MQKKEPVTREALDAIYIEIDAIRKQIQQTDRVASEWFTQKSQIRIALNKELTEAMQTLEYAWICEGRKISN